MPRNRAPLPLVDHSRLTARQREVVALAWSGSTDLTIARSLNVSVGTVKIHLQNARQKTEGSCLPKVN